jgi:streptomycin 6-kinase
VPDGKPQRLRLGSSWCQTATVIEVPAVVRNKARAAGAEEWLERLPALVSSLEADWSITVGHPYGGGSEAFVAEATQADGSSAVLKVLVPGAGNDPSNEAIVLRLTGGDGCPVLYEYDVDRGALLMERLGRPMFELGLPLSRRLEILCVTAARIWRPAPDCGLPTGAEKARRLADFIVMLWEGLDHPCSERAVDNALNCARRRELAHRDERAVLVHGDVHQLNALQSDRGFKLVDPDGLLAEAEYDLGVLMRGDPLELLVGDPLDRARWLAARTGLDPVVTWEWGVIERLSTGLLCTQIHLQPLGRDTLRAAEAVSGLTIC